MGAFSLKFSIAPITAKLLIGSKQVRGCKNGTDLLYRRAKYNGDCASRAGCFLFVTLWKYKVCDNGNAMKQCYFQNNYGAIACRKVCNCARYIQLFFCGTPEFSIRGKFIPKITMFRDLGGCKLTFLQPQRWNLAWGWRPWTSSSKPNFVKKSFKGVYPFWANLYRKIPILAIWELYSHIF